MQNEITTATEPQIETTEAPLTKPKTKKGKKKGAPEIATLETASEGYLGSLESDGASIGTVASYRAECVLAMGVLGRDTKIADLTIEQVTEYFASKPLNKTRTGRVKSTLTTDKSKRVFRQLMNWCVSAGWIETAPLPESK